MKYQIRYSGKVIKEFDERSEAIKYVDNFFKCEDYDGSSMDVDIYLADRKLYSAYLNVSYKE